MVYEFLKKKVSPTRKRVDATISLADDRGNDKGNISFRILSRKELSMKDVRSIIKEIIQRRNEAARKHETSEFAYLAINSVAGASAYIK